MDIQILPSDGMTPEEWAAIHALEQRVDWGHHPDGRSFVWSESAWHALVRENGHIVSHVGIVDREVLLGDHAVRIAGIASVMTDPKHEGRGYAKAGLERATAFIRESMSVPFAILLCLEHRHSLYLGLGWSDLSNPVYCDQPEGKVLLTVPGRYMMQLPVTGVAPPGVTIDLCGPPW